jgi:hypothetical protein
MRPNDPAFLSPEERLCEIARLLANGLRRLSAAPAAPVSYPQPGPEKPPEKLPELP